jgi:hypothetical protein
LRPQKAFYLLLQTCAFKKISGHFLGVLVQKKVFLIIAMMFLSCGAAEAHLSPLILDVAVVLEVESQWTGQQINQMFSKANRILSVCSIQVRQSGKTVRFLGEIPMGYESVPLANFFYETLQTPVVILVNGTQYNTSAGLAPGSRFLFLSNYSRTTDYQAKRHINYEPLAHELGHMLGGLTHLNETTGPNLMSGYSDSQNDVLNHEQCLKMRNHPHLLDEGLRF